MAFKKWENKQLLYGNPIHSLRKCIIKNDKGRISAKKTEALAYSGRN